MVATWDDSESESKEEIDTANMCFMAHGEDATKVCFENSLDEDELTMDELAPVSYTHLTLPTKRIV